MAAKKPASTKSPKASSTSAPRSARRTSKRDRTAGESMVTMDRRRADRRGDVESDSATPGAPLERRKKVQRRRQIDPTTCERDYSVEEVEFMNAMDEYKRKSGRMFPTCSEVLEVIRDLGYVKLSPSEKALLATEHNLPERLDAVADSIDSILRESL
jgi:hypothetical protein